MRTKKGATKGLVYHPTGESEQFLTRYRNEIQSRRELG
jgi:hypothetical protein